MTKKKEKKFRQTRQLVKLALMDGWTQKKIASVCRTQQSVVSAWARGEKYSTEGILKPLLEIYGSKIRRKSFRVYHCYDGKKSTYHKVEGTVVFTYTFTKKEEATPSKHKEIPVYRILIHNQGENNFRIIYQYRPKFEDSKGYIECDYDAGIWFSTISEKLETKSTITHIESHINEKLSDHKSEQLTIPFLIRKSFIERGFLVDGVVEYPATW